MKRILFTCASLCALMLALSVLALAQKGANFAGTWELDKSKSQMNERMAGMLNSLTLTVTQDEKSLKVDPKADMAAPPAGGPPAGGPPGGGGGGRGGGGGMMGGGFRAGEYKLDGSEVMTENQRGKTTTKANWKGSVLEIASSNTFNGPNGEMTTTTKEHWELTDGGKSLKVHRVQETQRGPQETTFVFNKK